MILACVGSLLAGLGAAYAQAEPPAPEDVLRAAIPAANLGNVEGFVPDDWGMELIVPAPARRLGQIAPTRSAPATSFSLDPIGEATPGRGPLLALAQTNQVLLVPEVRAGLLGSLQDRWSQDTFGAIGIPNPRPSVLLDEQAQNARQLGLSSTFSASRKRTGLGLDLGFTPRAGLAEAHGVRTAGAGAEVRLGQFLPSQGAARADRSWYVFAGAEGEALTLSMDKGQAGRDVRYDGDFVMVGDVQAGFAMQFGKASTTFGYLHREVSYDIGARGANAQEGFAAFTFTMRR